MPILYDDILVSPSGILTVQEFPAPRNGRMVKFTLPNGYARKSIYTCIDGKYTGPFSQAVPLETSVCGFELLRAGAHTASVIVIDTTETQLQTISLNFNAIPVRLSSGEQVGINLNGTVSANIRVNNSEALLLDYSKNGISNAEKRAANILRECFKREILRQIPESIGSYNTMSGLGILDQLAENIKDTACRTAEQYLDYPWFEVTACALNLMSSNMQEIVEKENYLWRRDQERDNTRFANDEMLRIEASKAKIRMTEKTADALLTVYAREPIPPEMTKLLAAYVQTNPQIQTQDLIAVCEKFKSLSETYSVDSLLKSAKAMGYLPDNSSKENK